MASLGPSKPAAGGMPPSPAPDTTDKNNSHDGGEGNRKRKADEAFLDDGGEAQTSCIFLDLPQEVLSIIASFQYHKDRISVATTCRDLLKAVEGFSAKKLEEMSHRADDTWWARISDQSTIETEKPKPLELPHRYLLSKALRSYLYTLCSERTASNAVGYQSLGVNAMPDGESLISYGNEGHVRLWDLPTKQSSLLFDGSNDLGRYSSRGDCLVSGNFIVSIVGSNKARVLTLSGEVVYQTTAHYAAAGNDKVFFARRFGNKGIVCFDTVTGQAQENAITSVVCDYAPFKMLVVGNMLVALCGGDFNRFLGRYKRGALHIFDTGDFSRKQVWPETYSSIEKASDDSNTIVASRRDMSIDVLNLQNGRLSRRNSFPFSQASELVVSTYNVLLVKQSLAFVDAGIVSNDVSILQVYNILTGELVQTFPTVGNAVHASTNGREIFFGFNTTVDANKAGWASIWAFPATMV